MFPRKRLRVATRMLDALVASPGKASAYAPQALLLSVPETAIVARRRERLLGLPDDVHVVASERMEAVLGWIAAFCGKSLIVKHPRMAPVRNFLMGHRVVLATILSGLPVLRPLSVPVLRLCRPLQWLVVPFWSMSLPVVTFLFESAVRKAIGNFLAARSPKAAATQIGDDVRHAVDLVHSKMEAGRDQLVQTVDQFLHTLKAEIANSAARGKLKHGKTLSTGGTSQSDGEASRSAGLSEGTINIFGEPRKSEGISDALREEMHSSGTTLHT